MALELWRCVANAQKEWHKRRGHGRGRCHPEDAEGGVRDCFSQMSHLAIARRVAGDLGGSHGGYHVLNPNLAAKLAQAFLHHDNRLMPHLAVAVYLVNVKRRAGFRVIPALFDSEGDEVWRTPIAGILLIVERDLPDVAWPRDTDVIRTHPLGRPEPLAAREFDQYPALLRIRKQVRVAAISRIAILVDQFADDLHGLPRGSGPFHDNSGKIAVIESPLWVGGHLSQLFARRRPDVTGRH